MSRVLDEDLVYEIVVNHAGRLAPGWDMQRELLADEGVEFKDENHADIKKYQWRI